MREVFEKIKEKCQKCSGIGRSSFVEFLKIIDEVAEEYNNGWIPCSERLPSFEERKKSYCRNAYGAEFIVMIEGSTMPTTLYIKMEEDIWFDDNYNYYNVIAWQPLPEPYQPKGDNNENK